MAGKIKALTFSEGVAVGAPTEVFIDAGSALEFASDAAYVASKGVAAAESDFYWNTADKTMRVYNGTAWAPLGGGSGTDIGSEAALDTFLAGSDLLGTINASFAITTEKQMRDNVVLVAADKSVLITANITPVAEVTDVTAVADVGGSLNNKYFYINSAYDDTEYYVWINVASGGTDPAIPGKTGIEVAISTNATAADIGGQLRSDINAVADFTTGGSGSLCTVTCVDSGSVSPPSDAGTTGFTINVTTAGEGAAFLFDSTVQNTRMEGLRITTAGSDTPLLRYENGANNNVVHDCHLTVPDASSRECVFMDAKYCRVVNSYISTSDDQYNFSGITLGSNSLDNIFYGNTPKQSYTDSYTISLLNIDWDKGSVFKKNISTNETYTFSNAREGEFINVILNADGTNRTVNFPAGTAEISDLTTVADVGGDLDGTYFVLRERPTPTTNGAVAFWYDVDNSGTTIPSGAQRVVDNGGRAVEITTIVTGDSANTVASSTSTAVNADSAFSTSVSTNVVTITNASKFDAESPDVATSGFSVAVTTEGQDEVFWPGGSPVTLVTANKANVYTFVKTDGKIYANVSTDID